MTKGVYWNKRNKLWMSAISSKGKTKHLGYFEDFSEAVNARKEAELKYFGEVIDR